MLNRNAVSLAAKVSNLRESQLARGGLSLGAPIFQVTQRTGEKRKRKMERGRKQVGVLRPGGLLCSSSPKVNIQMSRVLKFRCHGWVDLMCKLLAGVALGVSLPRWVGP